MCETHVQSKLPPICMNAAGIHTYQNKATPLMSEKGVRVGKAFPNSREFRLCRNSLGEELIFIKNL